MTGGLVKHQGKVTYLQVRDLGKGIMFLAYLALQYR
jgi:hypothetical protein